MGTKNEVYVVGLLQGRGFGGGANAAGEGNLLDAALAAEAVELAEVAADAVNGVLAHVAGVENDEVGVLVALDLGVSGVLDHAPHAVRVVHVHLASEGPNARGLPHPAPGIACGCAMSGARGGRRRAGFLRERYRGGSGGSQGITHTL